MMWKTPKLEKCLHCGGEGTFNHRDISFGMEGHFKDWWVECKSCGWHSKHYDQYARSTERCMELASESWNTRADGKGTDVHICEIVRTDHLECEVPSDYFNDIKYVRVVDEWTEEAKVFTEEPTGKWIPVSERLPENGTQVLVTLAYTHVSEIAGYGIARCIDFGNGERHWAENHYGYLEWDKYSDGRGGCSMYKVIAWQPISELYKGE